LIYNTADCREFDSEWYSDALSLSQKLNGPVGDKKFSGACISPQLPKCECMGHLCGCVGQSTRVSSHGTGVEQDVAAGCSAQHGHLQRQAQPICQTQSTGADEKGCVAHEPGGREDNTVSFTTLIKGWSAVGHIGKVKEVFNEMRVSAHVSPDVLLFNIYVNALGKAGELEAMEQAVSEMKQQGAQPNTFTFKAMLKGYTSHKQPKRMDKLVLLMKKLGVEMSTEMYKALMNEWSQAGRQDKVDEVRKEM